MTARIQPVVEVIGDPLGDAEAVVALLEQHMLTAPEPTGWLQQIAGRRGAPDAREHVPTYADRPCCYAHLQALENRLGTDLRLPHETDCPRCQRRFRVTLGAVDTTGRRIPWLTLIR